MKKCYYLSTCSTCNRIIEELNLKDYSFIFQDIKKDPIEESELEFLKNKMGGYDKLLNRRARKYRSLDLKNRQLSSEDLKKLILSEYTLLKRPVFIIDDLVFAGNSKKTLQRVENVLHAAK
jgi:arsenate reductase